MSFALKTTALAAALCAALATAPFTAPTAEAALFAQDEKQATLPDFVKLVEENGPAVVNIQIIRNARVVQTPGIPGMDERHAEIFRRFGFPLPFFPGEREIPEQRARRGRGRRNHRAPHGQA